MVSMKYLTTAFLILSAASLSLSAQQKTIVNLGGGKNAVQPSKKKRRYPSCALKLAPVNFLAGNMPLTFEKEYHNFSVQLTAGPTFHRFYDESYVSSRAFAGRPEYIWNDGQTTKRDVLEDPFDEFTIDAQYSMSYYVGAGVRFYYYEEGFDGAYVGFQFTASRYDYRMKTLRNPTYSFACSDRFEDLTFQWGYQYCGDHMLTDLYLGAGLRNMSASRPLAVEDYLSGTYVEGLAYYDKVMPKMEMGIRIGFIW